MSTMRILAWFAVVTAVSFAVEGAMAKTSSRGYIELDGGPFGPDRKGAKTGPREQSREHWRRKEQDVLAFDVNLPTPPPGC